MFKNYKLNLISSIFQMDKFLLFLSLLVISVNIFGRTFFMTKDPKFYGALLSSLSILIIVFSVAYSSISLSLSSHIAVNLSLKKSVFARHFALYNFFIGVVFSILLIIIVASFNKLAFINLLTLFLLVLTFTSFFSSLLLATLSTAMFIGSKAGKFGDILAIILTLIINIPLYNIGRMVFSKLAVLDNNLKSISLLHFPMVIAALLVLNFLFRVIFSKTYYKSGLYN